MRDRRRDEYKVMQMQKINQQQQIELEIEGRHGEDAGQEGGEKEEQLKHRLTYEDKQTQRKKRQRGKDEG